VVGFGSLFFVVADPREQVVEIVPGEVPAGESSGGVVTLFKYSQPSFDLSQVREVVRRHYFAQ
jgi:hypothetical protein